MRDWLSMSDDHASPHNLSRRNGPQAGSLIGRESELDRLASFLASARINGGALIITGEPGVGKTALLNAASEAAGAGEMRVVRAGAVEFEAGMSFSGLNHVLLPLL